MNTIKLTSRWSDRAGEASLSPTERAWFLANHNDILALDFMKDTVFETQKLYDEMLKRCAASPRSPSSARTR